MATTAHATGTARSGRPSISNCRSSLESIQAANAISSDEAGHSVSIEASLLVVVDLEQVDAVCDRGGEDAETEDQPATVELPAGEREDAEDGGQQQDIAERIGEVRRDRAARALEGPEHDLDEHGGAERRRGHGRREPVEPERSGERPCPALHQQHDRDVRQRIERDPADVGERREAGRVGGEGIELAERVARRARRHHRPRESIFPDEHRPRPGE